jgi:hypothetical protein
MRGSVKWKGSMYKENFWIDKSNTYMGGQMNSCEGWVTRSNTLPSLQIGIQNRATQDELFNMIQGLFPLPSF